MKYISPLIQVGYVFQQTWFPCMDSYSDDGGAGCDTSHSVSCSSDALISLFSVTDYTDEIHQPADSGWVCVSTNLGSSRYG